MSTLEDARAELARHDVRILGQNEAEAGGTIVDVQIVGRVEPRPGVLYLVVVSTVDVPAGEHCRQHTRITLAARGARGYHRTLVLRARELADVLPLLVEADTILGARSGGRPR
jgi:hypothetical protein